MAIKSPLVGSLSCLRIESDISFQEKTGASVAILVCPVGFATYFLFPHSLECDMGHSAEGSMNRWLRWAFGASKSNR